MTPPQSTLPLPNPVPLIPVLKREYLDMIPEFHGERELLPRFIDICEKIVKKFYNRIDTADFQNEYLMSSILSKIKGDAAINISSSIIDNWGSLKDALINTYSDKRDIFTLNLEMSELKQMQNETVFEFHNRLQNLLNLSISFITTQCSQNSKDILCDFFNDLSLRILLRGLKEPVGQLMRAKNPKNINEALNMLTNDFQFDSGTKSTKPVLFPKKPIQNFNKTPQFKPMQPFINRYNPHLAIPRNNNNMMFRNNNFRTQNQSFNRSNQFPSNRIQSVPKPVEYKPTPMSISTNNTFRPRPGPSAPFRTNQRPNFISEELFNIEENTLDPNINLPVNSDNFDDNYYEYDDAVQETFIPDNQFQDSYIPENQNFVDNNFLDIDALEENPSPE